MSFGVIIQVVQCISEHVSVKFFVCPSQRRARDRFVFRPLDKGRRRMCVLKIKFNVCFERTS